ncbi:hypothetical protein ACFXKD_00165 [Nocardiopsis aegyptia]|uniref:hypothetical protein n=1 Tax=Nocardiopsis aegyptia TaxID=220378 RepID=UPI003672B003
MSESAHSGATDGVATVIRELREARSMSQAGLTAAVCRTANRDVVARETISRRESHPMHAQITDPITPYTGRIDKVAPAAGGHSATTTAVVTGEHGQVFVKAVPDRPGGLLQEVEREGQINPYLGRLAPALLWQARGGGWFVLGFEVIDARPTDYTPGSPDLPRVVEAMEHVAELPLPEVARPWVETRWDRALSGARLKPFGVTI